MHMVPDARWAGNFLAVLLLWPSRLAIIVSPWEFGPALTSYRTHRRTSNSPQTAPIVGSRFSYRAYYNEFVKSGAKSWALMRRWLVLGMKGTQNQVAQRPKEKGPLAWERECANPSRSRRSPLVYGPPLLFILFFRSSSSYTCQSSMPILKCTSPQPFFLALCELL